MIIIIYHLYEFGAKFFRGDESFSDPIKQLRYVKPAIACLFNTT